MERKRNTDLFNFYSKLVSGKGSNKRIRSGSVSNEPDISNEDIRSGVALPKDFKDIHTYL
jgi:hypothetical protein